MEWYWWVIIVLGILIIGQFIGSYFGFRYIIPMKPQSKNFSERDISNTHFSQYEPRIKECFEFINSLPKEDVYIKSKDGLKLHGRYINNNSDKTIIFVHGYRATPLNDFSWPIKRFYLEGYNILYIDQRCHGESEGKYVTLGVKERIDVLYWVNYINERFKPKNIILHGMSMGCASVEMALSLDMPANVKAAILDCGFSSPFKLMVEKTKEMIKVNAFMTVVFTDIYCRLLAGFSLMESSSKQSLKKVNIPCFFIHGKADKVVPFDHGIENYNACSSKVKESVFVDGVGHAMCYYTEYPNLEERIIGFINQAINKESD